MAESNIVHYQNNEWMTGVGPAQKLRLSRRILRCNRVGSPGPRHSVRKDLQQPFSRARVAA
jgi:hypothetical protein